MGLLTKWAVLGTAIIFHLAFLMSIFDVYFVSPLVHGMQHHNPTTDDQGVADRLFLIVGDGLRADKCLGKQQHPVEGPEYLAPFLRSKILEEATFGISHTRVPTESRPGHVALIAGFYEDVSAVTKGWQENPVDFDSVFNQSEHTWSWGSPDILPMFGRGATKGKVEMNMYDHTFEDFTKSSIELDKFVFDRVDKLFEDAKSNATLNEQLHSKKIIFFLHLLGIDTAGHSYRPYSAEYYDNIKYIDGKIQELEKKINDFYDNDGKTAWVFTADHGMSDFGSHGDGHPNNTKTPLVVWGSGVNAPVAGQKGHDEETLEWEIPVERHDVSQADIASLMAYLVGINYPANSVGELPLPYLDADVVTKAKALEANALTIAEQYLVKENQVSQVQYKFKPYDELAGNLTVHARKLSIDEAVERKNFQLATDRAEALMGASLDGLKYLQKYNWLFLRSLITLGFVGWILYAYTSFLWLFIVSESIKARKGPPIVYAISAAVFASLCAILAQQRSPPNYYLYAFFPVYFWHNILMNVATIKEGTRELFRSPSMPSLLFKFAALGVGFGSVEAMVYGYFHREIFSVVLLLGFLPWPFVSNWRVAVKNAFLSLIWVISCISLAVISLQPVVKVENLDMIVGSGILAFSIAFVYTVYLSRVLKLGGITMVTFGVQLGLILLSVIVTRSSVLSLQARNGLPIGSQLVGWMTLVCSFMGPAMHSLSPVTDWRFQFLNIFTMFAPTMVILSISYECYFYLAFSLMMFSWIQLEKKLAHHFVGERKIRFTDFRMAIFFLFYTHIAFFGTGNIASISSFSLDSVYRLIPVFNPFAMSALLIFKLLVPFILLSASLGYVNTLIRLPSYCIFAMVLSISDILSLNFFYLVIDEGSWLDIGTGISHYCICSLLCLFIILIEYASSMFAATSTGLVNTAKTQSRKKVKSS